MSFASAALLVFLVIAPIGNIPFVLAALKKVAQENKRRILIREFIIGLVFLLSFLFFGNSILKVLSIEPSCLGIAGGIVLFLISLRMIFSTSRIMFKGSPDGEPLIVPLAVPGIAGSSSITTVLLFSNKEPERLFELAGAIIAAWFVSSLIMFFSERLRGFLGERGVYAMERLMGMLLTIISVQLFMNGVKQFMAW